MAVIDYIEPWTRRVYLSADTVGVDFQPMDAYKEMRTSRRLIEELRKAELFMVGLGKEPKGTGKFTERYVKLLEGTRFVPYDVTQVLNVIGTVITDDEQEGVACFDRDPLTVTTRVDINYVPPQVEVIEINTGSTGGLTTEEHDKLLSVPTKEENATAVANELLYQEIEMAQGSVVVFNESKENLVNLAIGTSFKMMLITTLPAAADLTPDSSDYTEVTAGGGYTAGGEIVTLTVSEATGTVTVDCSDVLWTSAGSGDPANIVSGLIYDTVIGTEDALAFIDLTVDGGTTPVSLLAGNIAVNFPNDLYTLA